jgi:EmrB/QacA subfamily drug resistance transporter
MGQLDASIVTLALPPIQRTFHAGLGAIEWVSLAYLVTLVVLVVPAGRLADMFGRKLLYVYGFAIFTLGSVLCGLAPTLWLLVAFRVLQAAGAALLQSNSVALIATAIPQEKLGRAIGIQGAAQAVGLSVGPLVGGALVAAGGWRWVFLVNAPVGVVGIATGLVFLPRTRFFSPRARFDRFGLTLFAIAVGSCLFTLSYLGQPQVSGLVLGVLAVVTACGAIGFITQERRATHPLLDAGLFGYREFTGGLVAGLLCYLVLFGVLFATPFALAGRGLGAATVGLLLSALPIAIAITAPFGGRVADRLGPKVPAAGGMLLVAGGLAAIAVIEPGSPGLAALLALVGVGMGAFIPANNSTIMASAPAEKAGAASGVLNMTRGVGTALGVALTGIVLAVENGVALLIHYRQALWLLAVCAGAASIIAWTAMPRSHVGRRLDP